MGFSPRDGEIILKLLMIGQRRDVPSFRPRNGEVILKTYKVAKGKLVLCGFSPRDGE